MDHYSIARRWADGTVFERGLKGHHMFCTPDTIYSYGYHFPIATRRDGCVLVNADKRSASTSEHQTYVRCALVYTPTTFTIPLNAWNDKELAVEFYRDKIIADVKKFFRARVYKDLCMEDCRRDLSEFRRFCEFHKIDFDAILQRDTALALSCAIIALNPGG